MKDMGWKISLETAVCLYTAILTDTGSFRFDNTTPRALNFASELVNIGVKPSQIYKYCYESNSKELVLFQAHCIGKAVLRMITKLLILLFIKRYGEILCR